MSYLINIGIIGNGRMAKKCAAILKAFPAVVLTRIIIDGSRSNISPDLEIFCEAQGIDYIISENINNHEVIKYLCTGHVDLIFSINNYQIIRGGLLDVAPEGIINFHNGPLPRYGGLNACSWAIFNGEARHGVSWHFVTAAVAGGDIVAQKLFDIASEATALQLVMTCINEGIALFENVIADVLAGTVSRTPQDKAARLYHLARAVPGGGIIDFTRDLESIQRLVRALNYNPLESPLGRAVVLINDRKMFVDKVSLARRVQQGINGEVMRADNALEIQVDGAILAVLEARDEQKRRLPVEKLIQHFAIKPGMHIGKELS